jgi:ElaB/YqjD/DUF883 family membrane-anchored ribosome-binding protein
VLPALLATEHGAFRSSRQRPHAGASAIPTLHFGQPVAAARANGSVGVAVVLKLFAGAAAPVTAPLKWPMFASAFALAPEGPEIRDRKTHKPMGARGASRADALGQARVGAIEPKAGGDVVPQDKPQEHIMAQSSYSRGSDLKDKASEQFNKAADQVESMANRVADQGREAGERMQEVAGNFKGAVDRSLKDQPMATLAGAAVVGFVLGALWKS